MNIGIHITAWLAGLLHLYFFTLESLLWGSKFANKTFKVAPENVETLRLGMFNQGAYNLLLGVGMLVGWYFWQKGSVQIGKTLLIYTGVFMVGAALALLISGPHLLRGVLAQGLPPLMLLIFLMKDSGN